MRDRNEVKRILVERLGREGGEAILDRLLYAYQALRGLSGKELLKIAEECGGIEVIRKRYRPWDDGEVIIVLRLRGFESRSDAI